MLAAGQEWGARNLSETFEVTQRTIQRDMLLLENAGLVLRTGTPRRVAYRLAKEATFEHPQWTLAEVISLLALLGRMPEDAPDTERAMAFSAISKVAGTQPPSVRRLLETLIATLARQPPALQAQFCGLPYLSVLLQAIVGHRALRIWSRADAGSAVAEPLVLVPATIDAPSGQWVVAGYKVDGEALLTVELANVAGMEFDVGE